MRNAVFALAPLLATLGCSSAFDNRETELPYAPPPPAVAAPPAPQAAGPYQIGVASYYSDHLAGHATSTGEPYDPTALTAAHRTLPLGTIVDVQRRDGRLVRVRINDRGPYADGRILDLSRAAATQLGMIREGTSEVALWIVYLPPPRKTKHLG